MCLSLLLVFLLSGVSHSYKVLVYSPRQTQSVSNFLGNIADTLVDAGHNVTTLIPNVDPLVIDGTLKSRKIFVEMDIDDIQFVECDDSSLIEAMPMGRIVSSWLNAPCSRVLDEPGLMERLAAENFDVMIVEMFEACGAALSHVIKPKSLITTFASTPFGFITDEFGLDWALSYNPSPLIPPLDVHSFWDRLSNVYAELVIRLTWMDTRSQINSLFYGRFDDFPGLMQICSNAAFTFINSESLVDFAVPTITRVLYIGGIGAKEPQKLDKDFDRLLTLHNKTVLISLGSIVVASRLQLKMKQSIVEVVSRFPEVTFIWKYETPEDEFAKSMLPVTPNLHLRAWTPQNDLLADERLTAFITHGGMGSTQEALLKGVPALFIPFMGDQPRNAGMMERSGVGKVFNKIDIYDAEKFHTAVKDLLKNQNYRLNAQRLSEMIKKKPFSAREIVIKTIEFAAEFGPSPALRPQSFDMNWIQYYNADILFIFTLIVVVSISLSLKVVVICVRKLFVAKTKRD